MDDRIRISDADRDRVASRLRDHYAEGRLTLGELDERITATLNAKTAGELGPVLADLPGPALASPQAVRQPPRAGSPWIVRRRGPRLLPLLLLVLLAALVTSGGGWLFFAFLKAALLFWLVACVAGVVLAGRFRRRMRRDWQSGRWDSGWPGGHHHHGHQHPGW